MGKFQDLTGQRFGRLVVLRRVEDHITPKGHHITMWECRCDCGATKAITGNALKNNTTKSCGCITRTHGMTKTRLFNIWADMKQRCTNLNQPQFHLWGGKGVTVCEEWLDFKNFYKWATTNGYADHLTLERIDGNKNYEPNNCKWATAKEQARNTSRNHRITIDGETKLLCEWLEISPITASTYHKRVKQGMTDKEALFTPNKSLNGIIKGKGR